MAIQKRPQPIAAELGSVLVFEWATGGGLYFEKEPVDLESPFVRQGGQMVEALTEDFQAAGYCPTVIRDHRLPMLSANCNVVRGQDELQSMLCRSAEVVDLIVLIAPETDSCLLHCCRWLEAWSSKLVSPNAEFIQLTSDKNRTAEILEFGGVPVPPVWDERDGEIWRVAKPIDGAGSERIVRLAPGTTAKLPRKKIRVEHLVRGRPASVSVLCGHSKTDWWTPLMPTWQLLSRPCGEYIGAEPIQCPETAKRAQKLAVDALKCLPKTVGYVGVDLVLDDKGAGGPDWVIEINPRMTTSYCYLRQHEKRNIAQAMVECKR